MSIEEPNKHLNGAESIKKETLETPVHISPEEQKDLDEALNRANIDEVRSEEEINVVSEEIKNYKSPEEIKDEIQALKEDRQIREEAYKNFTHLAATDTGMGGLGSFSGGAESPESLEKKFPGMGVILKKIDLAKNKNSVGFKFWKKPELNDYDAQVIKNYLITGSMGNFTDPSAEAAAKNAVDKFEAENSDSENEASSIRDAIWGNRDASFYEEAIANLNKKLVEME